MLEINKDTRGVYYFTYKNVDGKERTVYFTLDSLIYFDVTNGEFVVDYDNVHHDVKLTALFEHEMIRRIDLIYLKYELEKIRLNDPEHTSHILHATDSLFDDSNDIFFNRNKILLMSAGEGKVRSGDKLVQYTPHIVKFSSCFGFKVVNKDTYYSMMRELDRYDETH